MTGRPVRVAVIDSGLSLPRPHIGTIAAGGTSDAMRSGALVVAARGPDGVDYLPGSLDGVVPVELDWDCPRLAVTVDEGRDGPPRCRASGYPKPTPDEDVENELRGLSLAVANVTGLLARHLPADGRRPVTTAIEVWRRVQREFSHSDGSSRVLRP